MAIVFEGEKLPGDDGELRFGAIAGGDEAAQIVGDEFDVSIFAEALIGGLGSAVNGDDHVVEAGLNIRIGVEVLNRETGGNGGLDEIALGRANVFRRLRIEQRFAVVTEKGLNRIGAVAAKEIGHAIRG